MFSILAVKILFVKQNLASFENSLTLKILGCMIGCMNVEVKLNRERFELLMALAGMSRAELAQKMGVNYYTVNSWLYGQTTPPPDRIVSLWLVCNMPSEDMAQQRLLDWYTVTNDQTQKSPAG